MAETLNVDLCVIGAGSGGLSVAAGASQMGAKVALIEAGKMGGDCLNYGCVPSKSLLAAAKTAQKCRDSAVFGVIVNEPQIDFDKVMSYVHNVMKTISVNDSVERFTKLGVTVIQEKAEFIDKKTVKAGEKLIKARRFVIATGSSPSLPPIPGLDAVPFYTNETIFDIKQKPEHLIVIGGGPIGCELAQAFLMLGCKVTILEAFNILPRDEQDLVSILKTQLIQQKMEIKENVKIQKIIKTEKGIEITFEQNQKIETITGSNLLVATGRKPNLDLNLPAAGIDFTPKGIKVDAKLRTSNKHVYAIGDVVGPYQFTHVANYHAGIAIKNILFRIPSKVNYSAVPWVTYTEPELAHVGLTSKEALEQNPNAKIFMSDYAENDRAQTENEIIGKIKVITDSKGYILGASILGAEAGELILPWIMAIQQKKSVRALTDVMVPYPTLNEISKKVAGEFYKPLLFSNRIRKWVRFLSFFG